VRADRHDRVEITTELARGRVASKRDLCIAEVVKLDVKVEDGKVPAYRARLALSFKYSPE
jgi:flavin-binding protein dodecin